jgi:2-oxoglutarate ferredoxin oxidoreductase subunit alpha
MVIGAGWAGARSMTSTSGPGISLMAEFTGYAFFAEIPAVIWDVQRMGPSTGLPTRISQGDVLKVYFLGHGDCRHIVLLPANMQECFEFGFSSFDLAERLQTPVFVLSDLDMGMNLWPTEPFKYPEKPLDRGKVLSVEQLTQIKNWQRYAEWNDGIGWRTLPAPITHGGMPRRGHNEPPLQRTPRGLGEPGRLCQRPPARWRTPVIDAARRRIRRFLRQQ